MIENPVNDTATVVAAFAPTARPCATATPTGDITQLRSAVVTVAQRSGLAFLRPILPDAYDNIVKAKHPRTSRW